MKKLFLTLCIFIIMVICVSSSYATIYETMENSAVSIFSTGRAGSGMCSGTVIENGTYLSKVLTAKHCVDTFEITAVEGIEVAYEITSADDDLALLIILQHIPGKIPATFASRNAKRGEIVFHLGYPSLEKYEATGKVFLTLGDSHHAKLIVIPGCSGGGFYNANGELVGVVWGGMALSYSSRLAVYEPLSDVIRFLETIHEY